MDDLVKKKIGFLGGSFDPIHFGHLHLGISLQEAHKLDEVIVCPASTSPLKTEDPIAEQHRLAMAELAVQDLPSWRAVDWEITKSGPSYTIQTIKYALEKIFTSGEQIYLLLGEDLLPELSKWKEIENLLKLAPPLIGCRKREGRNEKLPFEDKLKAGMTPTNLLEISATEIRQRLKMKLYCGHLVPAKVLDYITLHRLYSST
jgi:nicotinate-nucleotide adenylyltransferase